MKKVVFFMSRRHARYKSEEIAPGVGSNLTRPSCVIERTIENRLARGYYNTNHEREWTMKFIQTKELEETNQIKIFIHYYNLITEMF